MLIKSTLAFDGGGDHIKMVLYSDVSKPLLISIILGLGPAVILLLLYSNFIYFILLASVIGVIFYTYFYNQLSRTSKQCLEEIKQTYL